MTLVYFIASVTLAWYLAPWLTGVLWFLPVREILDALTPATLFLNWSGYVERLLWAIGIYAVLRTTGFTVFAAVPQRYGTTPEFRFLKGLLAEALILTAFAAIVIAGLVASGYWNQLLDGPLRDAVSTEVGTILDTPRQAFANRPWQFLLLALRHVGLVAYPLAAILYLALGWKVKSAIARLARRPRRFFDMGREGVGGSSRFAGLIEEWALRDPRL